MKAFFVKIKDWFIKHKPTKRRLIQVYAALLYNANIKGFLTGRIYTGNSKYACVPGFNCYSCPGAVGACPLGSLQNALASSNTRWPFYVFGSLILFGLILGRTICGFLCPMGLIQDLLYKIKSPKLKKNKVTRVLSYFKYVLLVGLVVLIPLAYSGLNTLIPAFCKYICPVGTSEGSLSLLLHPDNDNMFTMLGPLFTWKFIVMVLIFVGSIFVFRLFCRFICPLGALYSFFCGLAMLGVKLDKQKCVDCGLCIQTCKMDIKHVGDHECIHCGDCLKVCPTQAISWKGSKILLHANAIEDGGESAVGETVALSDLVISSSQTNAVEVDTTAQNTATVVEIDTTVQDTAALERLENSRKQTQKKAKLARGSVEYVKRRNRILEIVAWALALVVLAGALVYYNFIHKDAQVSSVVAVGDTCPDFTMKKFFGGDGATYTLQDDLDEGRIVVLNFWYIGCQPCQAELPHFGELAERYSSEVSLVVIHSSASSVDKLNELEQFVPDTMGWTFQNLENVSFTVDNSGSDSMFLTLGGRDAYPITIVLDSTGVVRYAQYYSVERDELFGWVEELLAE